jgi:hypothetical protein
MDTARSSRRIRTISALLVLAGAAAASLAGCAGAGSSADGASVSVDDGFLRSGWIIEGDSIQRVSSLCEKYNLDEEPSILSDDRTRMTDRETGDIGSLTWYEDGSGFVWSDFDFIRADSEAAQPFIEEWEAECGREWLG